MSTEQFLNDNRKVHTRNWMEPLLLELIPSGLVIEQNGRIIYTYGEANQFLHINAGIATLNVFELVDDELAAAIYASIAKLTTSEPKININNVSTMTTAHKIVRVNLSIVDLGLESGLANLSPGEADVNGGRRVFVGFSQYSSDAVAAPVLDLDEDPQRRTAQLSRELASNRELLQTTIEALQTSNSELDRLNEELQVSNEELASVNEELSSTVIEYQRTNILLQDALSELERLQRSTQIALLCVNHDLTIGQFTESASPILGLEVADLGRSVMDVPMIHANFGLERIENEIAQVIASGTMVELETPLWMDRYFMMRILPYRLAEDHGLGTLIAIIDITKRKRAELALEALTIQLKTITDNVPARIFYADNNLNVQFANQRFKELADAEQVALAGRPLVQFVGTKRLAQEQEQIEAVLSGETVSFETEVDVDGSGSPTHELTTFVPYVLNQQIEGFFGLMVDITEQKMSQAQIENLSHRLKEINAVLEERLEWRTQALKEVYAEE